MREIIRRRRTSFVLLLGLTGGLPANAQVASALHSTGISDDLGQFVPAPMRKWKVPGLAIAIERNGEVIYSRGFGMRDLKDNLPATTKTIFAIGSMLRFLTDMNGDINAITAPLEPDAPEMVFTRVIENTEHTNKSDLHK